MGGVLSMGHSVLVTAAARFMAAFYAGLVRGETVGRAADEARRALVTDTRRGEVAASIEAAEEAFTLHDWFLPVLYQQRADGAPFGSPDHRSPITDDGGQRTKGEGRTVPATLTNPGVPGGLPPEPLHGFHGRGSELLRLERLFRDHAVVVLHGYGGQGKTTLAAEAGRWLHRAGRFPGGAAFIPFERGGGADLALSWTRQALLGDDFAEAEAVAAALAERPGLVIFDNFESVLAAGDAPLADADLRALLDLAWRWAGGDATRGAGPRRPARADHDARHRLPRCALCDPRALRPRGAGGPGAKRGAGAGARGAGRPRHRPCRDGPRAAGPADGLPGRPPALALPGAAAPGPPHARRADRRVRHPAARLHRGRGQRAQREPDRQPGVLAAPPDPGRPRRPARPGGLRRPGDGR